MAICIDQDFRVPVPSNTVVTLIEAMSEVYGPCRETFVDRKLITHQP